MPKAVLSNLTIALNSFRADGPTPDGFSPLRCAKTAVYAGVKYLAQVFLGLVFGSGLAVGFGGKYSLRSSNGFASHSGAQVVGQFGVNSAQLQLIRCSSS